MDISDEMVKKIAKLSNLELDASQVPVIGKELQVIFDYVDQLQKIDVSNVKPMSHVHGVTNVFREDVVQPSLDFEAVKLNAPDTSGSYIRVPLIIED